MNKLFSRLPTLSGKCRRWDHVRADELERVKLRGTASRQSERALPTGIHMPVEQSHLPLSFAYHSRARSIGWAGLYADRC